MMSAVRVDLVLVIKHAALTVLLVTRRGAVFAQESITDVRIIVKHGIHQTTRAKRQAGTTL